MTTANPGICPETISCAHALRAGALLGLVLTLTVHAASPNSSTTTTPTATSSSAVAPVAPAIPVTNATRAHGARDDDEETEWTFAGRFSLRATRDDNVTIRPSNEVEDDVFHVAPSLAYGIGSFRTAIAPYAAIPHFIARTGEEDLPRKDYAFISYTPDAVFFRKHGGEDVVNHDVRLAARQERDQWNASSEFHFQRVTEASLDLGQRVRQTYYTARARGERAVTAKISGGLGGLANRSEYAGGYASTDLRGDGFLDYQLGAKTTVGVGFVGGRLLVGSGADQWYQQPLVQIKHRPTEKIQLVGQAGEEFRQYDSDLGNRSRFVFAARADYEASDATTFNLSARRETQSSAQYSGENIVATLYQAGVRQRILQRLYLGLSGGHVRNEYENNVPTSSLSRRDNFYLYRASASADITRRGTLELSYEHRENDSTLRSFDFDQNLVSLATSFLF